VNEQTFLKEYFIYLEKKKARKMCRVKKWVHHLLRSNITECIGFHNHLSPKKVKMDPDIQRKIEDYSNVEVKTIAIQAKLIKKASKKQQLIARKNISIK
jgi:hypothetical protein